MVCVFAVSYLPPESSCLFQFSCAYIQRAVSDPTVVNLVLLSEKLYTGSNSAWILDLTSFILILLPGLLSVEDSLDYETQSSYQLTVRATDTKTSSYGEVHVDVTVFDVNDIPPIFNQSLYLAKVSEAVAVGTSVISVHAFDRDSGINKVLTYRLESLSSRNNNKSKVNEFFSIDKDSGEISVAKELDYERHIVHELKIIVSDGGTPTMTGEARARIVVEDANDNTPKFEQDSYASSISGDAGPGAFVTRVIATDPDERDAGKLRYSISSAQGKQFFHLDPKSGVLTIARSVGLERGRVYDIGVEVTDGKSTAETSVRVIIGDTNDHSPLFDKEIYRVNFHENYPEDTFVTMVTATDEDSGIYARVRYFISDLNAAEKFSIDAETGMIYSRLTFDRENSSHAFTSVPVQAIDGGDRFGFCTVEVKFLFFFLLLPHKVPNLQHHIANHVGVGFLCVFGKNNILFGA